MKYASLGIRQSLPQFKEQPKQITITLKQIQTIGMAETLHVVRKLAIAQALTECEGKISQAAKLLGVTRNYVVNWLNELRSKTGENKWKFQHK